MANEAKPERRPRALLPAKALAAFAAALVALVAIAALSAWSLAQRSAAAAAVDRANAVGTELSRFQAALTDAETGERGYLLTGDDAYLAPYNRGAVAAPGTLAALRRMTATTPTQQTRLDEIERLVATRLALLSSAIDKRRTGDAAGALALVRTDRGRETMTQLRSLVDAMQRSEQQRLAASTAAWQQSVRSSTLIVFGGAALLFAMLLQIGWFASRDYRAVAAEGWVRRLQLGLGNALAGDVRLESIGDTVLRVLAHGLDAQIGAIYAVEPGGALRRIAGHALGPDAGDPELRPGDGLTGQAAKDNRPIHLRDVPHDYLRVRSTLGDAPPREVMIVPAAVDGTVQAVTELGFLRRLDAAELEVQRRVAEVIAVAIRSARDRSRLEALLEETQRQAEELQSQQEELRVANEELEQQTRALQASQVQLTNQQAELEQINAQLEEQAQSLERQRDEVARAGAELQRANEYKSQFLANMSHELRTPLNSSLILAKLLADNRDGNLTPDQIRFAQTIHASGNDLLTLINDILDLSKIEAGMLDVRIEPVALARVADELAATFQPIAAEKQLALELRIAPGAPATLPTDAHRLQQILKNLMSNALKFTDRGGVTLEIDGDAAGVRFAVRDTGIGIPADQHEAIFEAFRQADAGSTRRFGGTGLGLSISRDLARLLGGELTVDSAPGRGSTFTLSLPPQAPVPAPARAAITPPGPRVARPLEPPKRPRPSTPPPAAAGPFPDDRAGLEPGARSLLVIEDDVAFARVLYDLAHELEFRAVVATTADDGLRLARDRTPSAIVLDIALPDRSGLAVLDALKRDPATRHIPVHVVSAKDHTRTALEMGAAGYALKPVEREELISAIGRLEAKFTQQLRRVLIVEDDARLRDSTAHLLRADDVETVTAGTTAEALALLRERTFDCMVLDLALPDRSGLELLEELSRGDEYSFPPVIVYTGRALSGDQLHELERFSNSIIIKGARSPERLLDEVTLFLHQVESRLPPERQRMLRDVRDREAVFEGRRILVVEDDVRNVFALSSVLEPRGAIVDIARNGREALDHLSANPGVDLVLMDIMMPEMDGLEATRRLRADPQLARVPVIALTAKAMIDDRERCLEAGANDYIAKPLDVDKLLSLARVWIRK